MGETQEERILQFLEENDTPVVGIREGAWLLCNDGTVTLKAKRERDFSVVARLQSK
jgi:dipeptidase E